MDDGLEVNDGYDINIGDDDEELFIMSKQKKVQKAVNRFKSLNSAKKGKSAKGKKFKLARAE